MYQRINIFTQEAAMINPFTVASTITTIQTEVLRPLYTVQEDTKQLSFEQLLVKTGQVIATHQNFITEVCSSSLVALIFKIVKLFGGADSLTEDDFDRFTSYVNDGGLKAMITMLQANDKERIFMEELQQLDKHVRDNAAPMLIKSRKLHQEFITGFFIEKYGSLEQTPQILQENFSQSDTFIGHLADLADQA